MDSNNEAVMANHVNANNVEAINSNVGDNELISENALRDLSKKFPTLIPKGDFNLSRCQEHDFLALFSRLEMTARSPRISFSHGAAALNALSGFLDRASTSSTPSLLFICFSFDSWKRLFDLFFQRSENNKPKPMRQLFLSLVGLLEKNPNGEIKSALKEYVACRTVAMIIDRIEMSSAKPAFQVLEYFLTKSLIDPLDLLRELAAQTKVQAGADSGDILPVSTTSTVRNVSEYSQRSLETAFVSAILAWIGYPDVAAAAGRLIAIFLKSLSSSNRKCHAISESEMSLWFKPLQGILRAQPELLETIGNHVLPELLSINDKATITFLQTLPMASVSDDRTDEITDSDIVLKLITIGIVAKLKSPAISDALKRLDLLGDEHSMSLTLLVHRSPDVRTRALSAILQSSSTVAPLSFEVLSCLASSICHLHMEVDPKSRNSFIALAKDLVCRVLRATWSSENNINSRKNALSRGRTTEHSSLGVDRTGLIEHRSNVKKELHDLHVNFLRFYMQFLANELLPTASYQRHITALHILSSTLQCALSRYARPSPGLLLFDKAIKWPGNHSYMRSILRPLFALIMDPFDDVRSIAESSLLTILEGSWKPSFKVDEGDAAQKVIPNAIQSQDEKNHLQLAQIVLRAHDTLRTTGRADHADGVARLHSLIWQFCSLHNEWRPSQTFMLENICSDLEIDVKIALSDLRLAVGTRPLHGHLIALRYIISQTQFYLKASTQAPAGTWEKLKRSALLSCSGVWEAIKSTLCIDSPEGHQCNFQDDEDDLELGTKDTLSFAWRALKESSLLLHAVMQSGFGISKNHRGLGKDDFQEIGQLSLTQLAELRHRGAFSTVSRTFALCCVKSVQAEDSETNQLTVKWYKDTLSCIQQNASALTRRSAGLPAMITGVLAAHVGDRFFDNAVLDLQAIADMPVEDAPDVGELRLPQVHALNSLKDIFADSRFGPSTEPYIADSLDMAASCLDSGVWAIRNSGLMLFNSLIRRLNGGSDIHSSKTPSTHRRLSAAAYERFSNLPTLILRLLRADELDSRRETGAAIEGISSFTTTAQRVFPALEIVARSGIPNDHKHEILDLIHYHMWSPAWPIREKAANTLAYVVGAEEIRQVIIRLLQPDWQSQNTLHGRLLCVRQLVGRLKMERPLDHTEDSKSDLRLLVMFQSDENEGKFSLAKFKLSMDMLLVTNRCPITAAAHLDILNDILETLIQRKSRFARYFGLILQKHIFNEWRGTDIDQPLGRPAPGPALSLESLQQLISKVGQNTNIQDSPAKPSLNPMLALQSAALERCADLIKLACGGGLSPDLLDEMASKKFSQSVQKIPLDGPYQADEALRSHGRLIGIAYANDAKNVMLQKNVAAWVCMLVLAGDAHTELSTRSAANHSIEGFFESIWRYSSNDTTSPALLGIYLALWDALVDDDEDVRDLGAKIASRIISRSSSTDEAEIKRHFPFSPPAVRPRLMQFIKDHYAQEHGLRNEAVLRLMGVPASQRTQSDSTTAASSCSITTFSTLLQEARKPDTALFVEEKQNLYIDEVEEARHWAHMLSELRPDGITQLLISRLLVWTTEGLVHVANNITNEEDGPFCWTSKPEVFTLVMRVILAAKVLISHGIEVRKCEELLKDIVERGIKNQLHDLLIAEILEVLGRGTVGGVWKSGFEDINTSEVN